MRGLMVEVLGGVATSEAQRAARAFVPFYDQVLADWRPHWQAREAGEAPGAIPSAHGNSAGKAGPPTSIANKSTRPVSVFVLLCGEGMAASTLSKLATAEWERTVGADGEQNTGAAAARRTLMGKPGTDTPTGMALVRLQRALLEQALEQAPTTAIASVFFALIPATALPLRPLDELGRLLQADGRSRFVLDDAGNRGKIEGAGERRIATSPSSHGHAGENETVSEWPAVIPASEVLRHSPWMILNRRDAELIVRNDLTGCCVGMAEPERTYVGTVLRASGVMVDGELETSVVPLVTVAEELKSRAGQLGTGAWFG